MRLVIGIGGLKRSGKDEFAKALLREAAVNGIAYDSILDDGSAQAPTVFSYIVAFADALRQTAAAAYGVPVHEFTDDALKDEVHPAWGITRRQMLINLGVPATLIPPFGADHWVKRWQRSVAELGDTVIVAPDLRRTNESAAVHALGVNVLICRSGVEWNGHITEKLSAMTTQKWRSLGQLYTYGDAERDGLGAVGQRHSKPVFDLVINNDSNLAALREQAALTLKAVLNA